MEKSESISNKATRQEDLYSEVAEKYSSSLERLASAYEADPEKRRDLIQEIHLQLWRSFQQYDALCSLRTWVYRVAHHVAVSHVIRERRMFPKLVNLEELESLPDKVNAQSRSDQRLDLNRLSALIRRLKPIDRQVIVSYLEDVGAESISEITGLSPPNVAVRIGRIKNILAKQFHEVRRKREGNEG